MKTATLLFLITYSIVTNAQNLVPNPSFEDTVGCPTGFLEIPFVSQLPTSVTNWTRPTQSSSDYFNACALPSFLSVPANVFGVQDARTGSAYCGLYAYSSTFITLNTYIDYREYLQTQLSSTMIAGHKYYVAYSINLGGAMETILAIDRLGVLFLPNAMENPTLSETIPLTPQLQTPAGVHFTDTTVWTTISHYYTATGNESWMILGNFISNANIDSVFIKYGPPPNPSHERSYYYYDDVCVLDLDGDPLLTSYSDTVICTGENIRIKGRTGAVNFYWNDADTLQEKEILTSGVYWVKSIDYDNCAFYIDSFKVTVGKNEISIDIGNDTTICSGVSTELKVNIDTFTNYMWNTGANTSSIIINEPGTYFVKVESECYFATDTIVVTEVPKPEIILLNDTVICKDDIPLVLRYEKEGMTNYWSTGDVDTCCIEIIESGIYNLKSVNVCGDSANAQVKVDVSNCQNCLFVPNAFSPNQDGLNDIFEIKNNCDLTNFKIQIYNRYGQLVFTSVDVLKSWDGYFNGKLCDVGVYFYYIEAKFNIANIKNMALKGEVTLMK